MVEECEVCQRRAVKSADAATMPSREETQSQSNDESVEKQGIDGGGEKVVAGHERTNPRTIHSDHIRVLMPSSSSVARHSQQPQHQELYHAFQTPVLLTLWLPRC